MEIQFFEDTDRRELWLAQMENCSWRAGRYLYTLLKEDRFQKQYGETSRVLLLTDGEKLVSFCTYAERDEIPDTELKPWMGFVYTDPEYRGRGFGRTICRALLAEAAGTGIGHAYLQVVQSNTPAMRLYESLGFRKVYTYRYLKQGT